MFTVHVCLFKHVFTLYFLTVFCRLIGMETLYVDNLVNIYEVVTNLVFVLQLYHQVYDEKAKDACLQLVGIVTYYGKHYSTFFFHSKLRTWIYFDDARVKEVSNASTSRSDY